jgi:hypothetical protein
MGTGKAQHGARKSTVSIDIGKEGRNVTGDRIVGPER